MQAFGYCWVIAWSWDSFDNTIRKLLIPLKELCFTQRNIFWPEAFSCSIFILFIYSWYWRALSLFTFLFSPLLALPLGFFSFFFPVHRQIFRNWTALFSFIAVYYYLLFTKLCVHNIGKKEGGKKGLIFHFLFPWTAANSTAASSSRSNLCLYCYSRIEWKQILDLIESRIETSAHTVNRRRKDVLYVHIYCIISWAQVSSSVEY